MTCPRSDDGAETGVGLEEAVRVWGGGGWKRYLFPGFWLVYLGETVSGVSKHSHGGGAIAGYAIVVVFAACYLIALPMGWDGARRGFWWLFAFCALLTAVETTFAHDAALVFCVYLAVLVVAARTRFTAPAVVLLATATAVVPVLVPGWHGHVDWSDGVTVALVGLAMFGFFAIISANIALSAARAEVVRLAAENERTRIARDLHDLLGHSLTTITVKAGLARRLADRDPAASLTEISEVEELSRRTMSQVRAAVSGYRDVTLAGEIATARGVLDAAGIVADLPRAIDTVDADAVEPFGWVLREAITNVVRHSRADRCVVTVGSRWIEIADDGHGVVAGAGNGLTGLRERLAAVGGTVEAGPAGPGAILTRGWRLRAELSRPGLLGSAPIFDGIALIKSAPAANPVIVEP